MQAAAEGQRGREGGRAERKGGRKEEIEEKEVWEREDRGKGGEEKDIHVDTSPYTFPVVYHPTH